MNEKMILTIIDKFSAASIAELDLNDGSVHLTLRKDGAFANRGLRDAAPGPQAPLAPGGESPVRLGLPSAPVAETTEGEAITSPIVATFYAAPGPDAPAFVKPGAKVKSGDTLCILEAMKMMNHLEAEFDCQIVKTHAASGDLVEYGQTLFTVKRL
ncbi:MAG: acetyl-CoA carboxylase biotin carboxyl carrier protein [Treponema sp.]|jgi:acetyl-CoA carboxylase biotin carboxyl carrier protein|nr:acetyl-CoA carboxylase biotin carboxyl carrier protein [Treponema sp.]